jgi:putative membrane protein
MKYTFNKLAIALLVAGSLAASCEDGTKKPEDSKEVAEDKNEAKFKTDSSEDKASFVVDAVGGNIGEIRLAQLAEEKSSSKAVKDIAKMLVDDHTAALNDLKTLATNKGISVPTDEPDKIKETIKDLSDDKPADFDKNWTKALMDKHEKTINDYEKELGNTKDEDIKAWINNVLPKIRTHHDKLMAYNSQVKK